MDINGMVEIAPGFFVRSWDDIVRSSIYTDSGNMVVYLRNPDNVHHVKSDDVPATLKAWRKHFGINSPFEGDYPQEETEVTKESKPSVTVGEKRKGEFRSTAVVLAVFTAIHDHPNRGQYSFSVFPPAKIERDILAGDTAVIYFYGNNYYMTIESIFIEQFPPKD